MTLEWRSSRERVSSQVVVLEIDWAYDGDYARSYVSGLDAELTAHDHTLLVRHGPSSERSTEQVLHAITPRAIRRFAEPYRSGHDVVDSGGGWRDGLAAHVALQREYLVQHGHTHIALALPPHASPLTEARHRLTLQHAKTLGLPTPPRFRADAVDRFRREHPETTGIAAFSDDVALRVIRALCVIRALRDLGLAVPGDVAVIGFDDTEYGAHRPRPRYRRPVTYPGPRRGSRVGLNLSREWGNTGHSSTRSHAGNS